VIQPLGQRVYGLAFYGQLACTRARIHVKFNDGEMTGMCSLERRMAYIRTWVSR
jgi:hypothetical protein